MANNLTDYAENLLLDTLLRSSTVYLALFTSDPGEGTGGTEVSGGAYARQAIAFPAASGGTTSNPVDTVFPIATADWGTITHGVIFDAASGGNRLAHGPAASPISILTGDQYVCNAGDFNLSLD